MIIMEGAMLLPPDRGTIIGRALWKTRYVILGTASEQKTQNDIPAQSERSSRKAASKSNLVDATDGGLYISIYKTKGEGEYIAQYPVSSFKSCEIKNIQHRKQGPSLPTLVLDFKPDTAHERQRKRRSSRTAGLTSKDPWAGSLLFRTASEGRYNIFDWQSNVKPQLTPDSQDSQDFMDDFQSPMSPLSPISPAFSSFSNPFAPRDTRTPSSSTSRPEFQQKTPSTQTISNYSHTSRERPSAIISPSPSLRSRRSDLSSQGSSFQPPMGFTSSHSKAFPTNIPSDLPSPASAYDTQFIEGWTSAQGRSSTLSSHTRGSNSIASAVAAGAVGSTPPGPRETILDRAFQMKYIPGSERIQDKDEEKISSIARFEALMREADERKRQKSTSVSQSVGQWELDERSEDSSNGEEEEEDDDANGLDLSDHDVVIPTPAQRALEYISGRRTPLPTARPLSPVTKSPPIPFLNPQAMSAFHGHSQSNGGGLRPRTGTNSSHRNSRPSSMALPSRSISATAVPTLKDLRDGGLNNNNGNLRPGDFDVQDLKRSSSTSAKRLSFQEFAKRLSSSSSLLLVQTNASSNSGRDGSRRTSSEYGVDEDRSLKRNSIGVRGTTSSSNAEREARDKRCGWRGSVGVFGSEGGFL